MPSTPKALQWTCICTYVNHVDKSHCQICGKPKPTVNTLPVKQNSQDETLSQNVVPTQMVQDSLDSDGDVADEDIDEDYLDNLERKLYLKQKQLERARAAAKANQHMRLQKEKEQLRSKLDQLEQDAERYADEKQQAQEDLHLLETNLHLHKKQQVEVEEQVIVLQKRKELDALQLKRMQLIRLQEAGAAVRAKIEADALHIQTIEQEKQERVDRDVSKLSHVLTHAQLLQQELDTGEYDEKDKLRLASILFENTG